MTAGNACSLNDGAAAMVVMSDKKAKGLKLTSLARIVSTGVSGLSPEIMGLGPVEASRNALSLAGMSISDIDPVEINEAFVVQVIGFARELNIDESKRNVAGGAIALGHPFGVDGVRNHGNVVEQPRRSRRAIRPRGHVRGQGMAMVIERLE